MLILLHLLATLLHLFIFKTQVSLHHRLHLERATSPHLSKVEVQQLSQQLAQIILPLYNDLLLSGVHIHINQVRSHRQSHIHKVAVASLRLLK